MLAIDRVGDGPPVSVGARPVTKSLDNQPAGQCVQLRHAARLRHGATADKARWLDPEGQAHHPADTGVAQMARVVAGRDFAGDLLKLGPAAAVAIAIAAGSTPGPRAGRRPGVAPAAR